MPVVRLARRSVKLGLVTGTLILDDEDADLASWRWRLHTDHYAVRGRGRPGDPAVYCHVVVMMRMRNGEGIPPDHVVDHINSDRLDCRRSNLQVIVSRENTRKRRSRSAHGICVGCSVVGPHVHECRFCSMPYCPRCESTHGCERDLPV